MTDTGDHVVRPLPRQGDQVRIPRGAYIKTTHPDGDRIAKRSQVVTVAHSSHGWEQQPPVVSWAGSGGYWCDSWEWEPMPKKDRSSEAPA